MSLILVTFNMDAPTLSTDGRHFPSAGHIQLCGHQVDAPYGLLHNVLGSSAQNMAVGESSMTEMCSYCSKLDL